MSKEQQRTNTITDHEGLITQQLMAEEEYKVERAVYSPHRTQRIKLLDNSSRCRYSFTCTRMHPF